MIHVDFSTMFMSRSGDEWPHFEFTKVNNEILLSIKLNLQVTDMNDLFKPSDTFKTIPYRINLTNEYAPVKK